MVLGELDSNMHKNETRPLSYTTYKNKLKMDERPQCKTGSHQSPRGESRQNLFDLGHSNFLLNTSLEVRETKAKMELLGPHQNKKLLHSKGNKQQN